MALMKEGDHTPPPHPKVKMEAEIGVNEVMSKKACPKLKSREWIPQRLWWEFVSIDTLTPAILILECLVCRIMRE